mgnify:CR=1 FL=1
MKLTRDVFGQQRKHQLILCNPNGKELAVIGMAKDIEVYRSLKEVSTLNFTVTNLGNEITPYYDLASVSTNGIAMDTYFIQANWDTHYWVRYSTTNDLLPSLVTYTESMSYYIDVAGDLQKMLYHPYATFIVRALNQPSTIIPVGNYIETTGIALNNFAGTLKGLDESQNYGFDFQGKSSFIKATTGASFYSLTIKGIGQEESATTQLNQAFVDNASLTSFENMTFANCYLTTEINENNFNVGVVANNSSEYDGELCIKAAKKAAKKTAEKKPAAKKCAKKAE